MPRSYHVGPHRVTCASIHEPFIETILPPDGVDVLYTDPPWGDGLVKLFATLRAKATGAPRTPPVAFDPMMDHLITLATLHVRRHVFIEMGVRWGDDVEARMRTAFGHVQRYEVRYGPRRRPSLLLHSTIWGEAPARLDLDGLSGQRLVGTALGAVVTPGGSVWDPFCGHGMTARAALHFGATFYGNEFNRARLARTLDLLHRAA